MNEQTQALRDDLVRLADDARALMAATADVAGQKVDEARNRLTAALAGAKESCVRVRDNVVDTGKAIDENVRQYRYPAIGIALGAGMLIGCLLARRTGSRPRYSPSQEDASPEAGNR